MNITPRRWVILGVVSLVLNVFLVGFVAGRYAFGPAGCSPRGFSPGARGERGAFFGQLAEGDRAELRRRAGAVREAREAVRAALIAEPFDTARLDTELSKLRERSGELGLQMHHNLLEHARTATPEQRRRLADARFMRRGPPLGP
jgi:uncharacterized membrane protein